MNIGVNTRFLQNPQSGIPYFIKSLYEELLKIDKKNVYSFFQKTPFGTSTFSHVLFDLVFVHNLIHKTKSDIYHGTANMLPLLKNKRTKYVLTVHDLSFLLFPENGSALFNAYYSWGIGQSLKQADVIIADSNHTKHDIMRFYTIPENKIKVIHLGVNQSFIEQQPLKSIISENYFFTLTTHPKRKNIYVLLDLFAEHKTLRKNMKFVIAGLIPEEQKKDLQKKISDLGLQNRVVLKGYVSEHDLITLYQHAKFFIYPSFYEGFGLPLIEAAYSRCPVLASNTSSMPEIVADKEWLFDPYNKDDITEKIDRLLSLSSQNLQQLIDTNYSFVQKFQWTNTAKNYLNIFNSFS